MKSKFILLLCIVCLILGHISGRFFVIGSCQVLNQPITKGDYYANWINAFSACGTILAVVVALFLEEIRGLFKKVKFHISLESKEALEDVADFQGTKKAIRYHNSIHISNYGNINARNCELYLESASFSSNNVSTTLPVENAPIKWNKDNNSIYIPFQGTKILSIFEFLAPQKQSTPGGKAVEISAKLKILGLMDVETKSGKWELTYCLNSINSKPMKFKYIIEWNGEWEERQKEMSDNLTMKLVLI